MKLTINEIVSTLRKSGVNSKHVVIDALTNASVEDLLELRKSINERINIKRAKE